MIRSIAVLAACAALTACDAPTGGVSRAAAPETHVETGADGACWAVETTPAIYESVMGQVQVVQAEIAEDGTVLRPPVYRNAPVPKVVKERGEIRFRAPCPHELTPEVLGTLQRALRVRGYYRGFVTSYYDSATERAVKRYQSERGLDSGQLSLETARDLGLVAIDLSETAG